jgi:ABC-type transport system involved in cytochrome c biogenesis ATPase subunit
LDEPTTHLDEGAAASFWEELSAHLTAGGCAVLSSHKDVPLPGAKVITFHG